MTKDLQSSFVGSLKSCAKRKNLFEVARIHADICSHGLIDRNSYLGNVLVSMYAKCGAVLKAQQVLHELPTRDLVSWSSLIAGYAQRGQGKEAVECYEQMQSDGLSPNAVTYTGILKACGITEDIHLGKTIHLAIVSQGLLQESLILGTALVDMYCKCGALAKAQQALDELHVRDIVSWSALITGYAHKGRGKEALDCYDRMLNDGLSPNAITYACILKACGITQDIERSKQIHCKIAAQELLQKDVVLGTALVDMYVKCGVLIKAQQALDALPVRNVVSWSVLIAGYARHGNGEEALNCFQKMQSEGISPNEVTYACILKACGIIRALDRGKQIHDDIVSQGLLGVYGILGAALVDMYAKCGLLTQAKLVLDELLIQNVGSWNALIAGYAEQGKGEESLDCYKQMQSKGFVPDAITYVCIVKICGLTKAFRRGEQIYDEVASRQGLLQENSVLGSALVDMFVKWGALTKAKQVFDELPVRGESSWNALIAGYAEQGEVDEATKCFRGMRHEGLTPSVISWNALIGGYAIQGCTEKVLAGLLQMKHEGISPDPITLVHVLNACSHSGLVDEGQMYYEIMLELFGIAPDLEHHICMVDIFGRAGHFEKVVRVIQKMPTSDHLPVWSALLGACQKWGNVMLGRMVFDCAVQVDKYSAATYVSMQNIYAAAGMHEDARKIEARGLKLLCNHGLII